MCGFVAQVAKRASKINIEVVKRMNSVIYHRGPDDEGYHFDDWIGLGFRRLSIIDPTSAGHQPMKDPSGRFVIVFNGEIYNYKEIKNELQSKGTAFHTFSDTEVLLQSYIHWGDACLDKLIGMFSFIIVDLLEKEISIVRDYPGIKPLYFTEDHNYWYFASELKAFKGVVPFSLNRDVLYEQFNYRYVSGEKTLLERIVKVLPGHIWKLSNTTPKKVRKICYFNHSSTFKASPSKLSFDEAVDLVDKKLQESFLLHTRSDVGFCAQLSGGVDSSYMAAALTTFKKDLKTYSISLSEPGYDEKKYQQEVVERYNLEHHSFIMTEQDYAREIERTTYHMDAPITHSGCVFLLLLCKEISKYSKVVLTGEGADELFGGYGHHDTSKILNLVYQMQKKGITLKHLPDISKLRTLKMLLKNNMILNSTRYQSDKLFREIFLPPLPTFMFDRDRYASKTENDYLNALLSYDQNTYLCSVLERQDRVSMAQSVEARVPFCSQQLYFVVNSICNDIKFKGGVRKALLKRCGEKYLSKELLYRKKNGLRLPLSDWYRNPKSMGQYLGLLSDKTAKERGLYQNAYVSKMIKTYRKGDDKFAKPIISLVNFEIWCRQFL